MWQPISETRRTPQLRVAVTPVCNLHCFFCRPEGEGRAGHPVDALDRTDIAFLVEAAARVGFAHVKFTGGEPLLRRDIADIIGDTAQAQGVDDVQLVTNGTLLEPRAVELQESGLSSLTLSLDAASPETFRAVRGGDVRRVLRGLEAARAAGLAVRINSVISRRNLHELSGLVDIARRYGTSLKLLDLVNLDAPAGDAEWLADFVPFSEVRAAVQALGGEYESLEPTPGGVGAPLLSFRMPDGLHVVIKDSLYGLYFAPSCKSCAKYPCQDAIIALRVTHDGFLKKCLARDDNLVAVREHVLGRDRDATEAALRALFDDMCASEFMEGAWKPPAPIPVRLARRA